MHHLSLSGWIALHAGLVGVGGRRALILGEKGAGKTTLLLRLLHDGHAVEGDEMVLVRDGEAMCLPRNFHLKPGTAALLPELAPDERALPATSTSDGLVIRAFNPRTAGFGWRLLRGPAHAAFVLAPDHGGSGSCAALSGVDLVKTVVSHVLPGHGRGWEAVRTCARLVGHIPGFELRVADLGEAAEAVVSRVSQMP